MILRPYQQTAIENLRGIFSKGTKRIILYSPTGSGKTEIGMEMIKLATAKGKKVTFVCNRIELVKQTSRRVGKSNINHGIIQGSNTCMVWEPVQICSIQTLDKRGYPETDMFIIDEAHGTAGSKAYQKLIEKHSNLPIIGLTATPFAKGLGKKYEFGNLWETILAATTIRELIDQGFLVDCDIYAPGEPDLSKVKIVAGDYNEKQLGLAVDKNELIGDIVEHWKKLGNNQSTVCFATNIAHSRHIVEQFQKAGIPAEHIDCYTSDDDRKDILERVLEGTTRIISNVGVLAEGWDFPACSVMILARPTRSLIKYIQMAGRVLRPFEGKEKALILDHSGTCKRLGFPTDDLPLFLDDGKPKDKQAELAKQKQKEERLPIICPKCNKVLARRSSKCPVCGHEWPRPKNDVHTKAGDLVQLRRGKKVKLSSLSTDERRQVYAELLGYASQKGFKQGWAWHKCKELFGSAPQSKPNPSAPTPETLNLIRHLNIKYRERTASNG